MGENWTINAPSWCSDAIKCPEGWRDRRTNELLVSIRTVPDVETDNEPEEKSVAEEVKETEAESESKEAVESDDLTVIKGIGNAVQQRLNEEGIYTYEQLGTLSVEKAEELNVKTKWVADADKLRNA